MGITTLLHSQDPLRHSREGAYTGYVYQGVGILGVTQEFCLPLCSPPITDGNLYDEYTPKVVHPSQSCNKPDMSNKTSITTAFIPLGGKIHSKHQ